MYTANMPQYRIYIAIYCKSIVFGNGLPHLVLQVIRCRWGRLVDYIERGQMGAVLAESEWKLRRNSVGLIPESRLNVRER